MTDPFHYFPRRPDGSLRDWGFYGRWPRDTIEDGLRQGVIPVPPRWVGPYDMEMIWVCLIECACGRAMPVPR